jgi:hypothetical protein
VLRLRAVCLADLEQFSAKWMRFAVRICGTRKKRAISTHGETALGAHRCGPVRGSGGAPPPFRVRREWGRARSAVSCSDSVPGRSVRRRGRFFNRDPRLPRHFSD